MKLGKPNSLITAGINNTSEKLFTIHVNMFHLMKEIDNGEAIKETANFANKETKNGAINIKRPASIRHT